MERTEPKAARELTILDGQQRLATASIVLSAIRRWLRDRGLDDDAAKIQSDYIEGREPVVWKSPAPAWHINSMKAKLHPLRPHANI